MGSPYFYTRLGGHGIFQCQPAPGLKDINCPLPYRKACIKNVCQTRELFGHCCLYHWTIIVRACPVNPAKSVFDVKNFPRTTALLKHHELVTWVKSRKKVFRNEKFKRNQIFPSKMHFNSLYISTVRHYPKGVLKLVTERSLFGG